MTTDRRSGAGGDAPGGRRRTSRRGFLAAAGTLAAASLAGCTLQVDGNGITWGGDRSGAGSTPRTTRTATTAPTTTPGTTTPDPTTAGTTTTQEFEVVTLEPSQPELVTLAPEAEPSTFRVHNVKLYLTQANDSRLNGPNTEEIYGAFFVEAHDARNGATIYPTGYDDNLVYEIDRDDAVSMEQGDLHRLPIDVVVEFVDPESVDRPASYIDVGATITERDGGRGGNDDRLGWWRNGHAYEWYLSQAPSDPDGMSEDSESEFTVTFEDRGSEVRLSFDVSPVN